MDHELFLAVLSVFFNHLDPKTHCKVLALRVAKLPAQLLLLALFQHSQIEWDGACQMFHVVPVTLNVALQLQRAPSHRDQGRRVGDV